MYPFETFAGALQSGKFGDVSLEPGALIWLEDRGQHRDRNGTCGGVIRGVY